MICDRSLSAYLIRVRFVWIVSPFVTNRQWEVCQIGFYLVIFGLQWIACRLVLSDCFYLTTLSVDPFAWAVKKSENCRQIWGFGRLFQPAKGIQSSRQVYFFFFFFGFVIVMKLLLLEKKENNEKKKKKSLVRICLTNGKRELLHVRCQFNWQRLTTWEFVSVRSDRCTWYFP